MVSQQASCVDWDTSPRPPSVRELAHIGLAALAARIVLVVIGCWLTHSSLHEWALGGDGISYIRYATRIAGGSTEFTAYDGRVFPGLPAMMAVLYSVGVAPWMGGLMIGIGAGAVVPALAARLFRDARVGWLLAIFPPIWLICSAGPATEAPLLALTLGAILIEARSGLGASLLAGLLFGLAGTIRPVACFAVLGLAAWHIVHRRWWAPLVFGAVALAVVACGLFAVHRWMGDALYGVRYYAEAKEAYGGDLISWPFKSVIFTPLYSPVAKSKLVYVWLHIALVIGGITRLIWQMRRSQPSMLHVLSVVWLAGNTLFVLCIGDKWGLHALPRFLLPAIPPLIWVFRDYAPRRWWLWLLLGGCSFAIALRHTQQVVGGM